MIGRMLMAGILGLSLLMAQSAVADDRSPDELVRDLSGRILEALENHEDEYRENPAKLEELIERELMPGMDLRYSARLILGRAGRGVTEEQLTAFADTMSDVLVERYASGMLEYRDRNQMEVLPLRGELNDRATRVRTRIKTQTGTFIPVDYMFRSTEEGWKVFDVIVEGISYVTTYRNQIMPQVQESGIEEVTRRLAGGELELSQ